jgi:putative hydrolase of the HAD superfamily
LRRWPGIFASFWKIYLSFLMGCRKPDAEIYNRILQENKRTPYECAFIDDLAKNGDWPIQLGMAFHLFQGLPQLARWLEQFEIKVD